jgi:hypothetical protein
MPKPRKSAEEVCIEYARVVAAMREQTAIIKPWECERVTVSGWHPSGIPDPPCDPCISTLLKKAGPFTSFGAREEYLEWQEEFKGEMCDRCTRSLKAIEERKGMRQRLGAAKRGVEAVGKRLQKEANCG